MSEESTPEQTESMPETPGLPNSVGETLAAARDAAGLSIDEVAAKLRLSVRQIRALEEGETATLPDATFVRGFIRNYAKLLGLQAEPLIAAYAAQAPSSVEQSISLHSENIRIAGDGRRNWLPYLLAVLLLLAALAAWLVLTQQHSTTPAAVPQPVLPAPSPQAPPATVDSQPIPPLQMPPSEAPAVPPLPEAQPVVEPSPSGTPAAPVSAPVTSAPIAGAAKLEMACSEEVWLSVLDRDGKEIFNKTKPANSQDVVEGLPPLQVVIGNAAGLRLTYNGKPVDLAPHTKANVARLTLE